MCINKVIKYAYILGEFPSSGISNSKRPVGVETNSSIEKKVKSSEALEQPKLSLTVSFSSDS